jgi:DNA-binding SARP family transcriptional activator
MDEVPPLALAEFGLELERSEKKMTIRGANLALESARSTGRADAVAAALIRLAHLHFRQGRYPQTRVLLEEVLRDAPPDSLFRCDALRMLGNCCAEVGEPDCAEDYYHQAVDLARQLDYHYALYKCLHSLATNIYWPRGQFELCLAAGKEALAQAQALHLSEELWFPLSDIAWVYWSTGQGELASQTADQMESVVCPGTLGEGFYCCLRAGLEKPGEGYLQAVLPLFDRARSIAETSGDPGLNVEVRLGLCRAYRAVKDFATAAVWAEDAVAVTLRMNYRQFQSVALIERARTVMDQDECTARKDLTAAIEIALALHANFDLARAYFFLAALEETPGPFLSEALRRIRAGGYIFVLDEEREISYPLLAAGLSAHDEEIRLRTAVFLQDLQAMPVRPLYIRTLGGLHVQVGTVKIEKKVLAQRRADELLLLLLLAPDHALTFEQVSEAMWPEKNPDSTRAHFHQACSKLRHALEPELTAQDLPSRYLFVEDGRVSLRIPADSCVDIHDFYAYCRQGQWAKALKIVHGDLLPEYPYAEWLFMERQRLSPLIQQALFLNAQQLIQSGQFSAGLEHVRRLLVLEPWHEPAVLLGMQACVALEDKTGARRFYKQLEKTLSEELGTQPHADLGTYFQSINARKK